MNDKNRPLPKAVSLVLAGSFALVGLAFLFIPSRVLAFFNRLSAAIGWPPLPVGEAFFFLILAVAYMYLVTVLAWRMFRHPENPTYPILLAHGKLASAVLSFGFFLARGPCLIFLVNGIIDGLIGVGILFYCYFPSANLQAR